MITAISIVLYGLSVLFAVGSGVALKSSAEKRMGFILFGAFFLLAACLQVLA